MHPLFTLALSRPGLIARHAAAYGELLAAELDEWVAHVRLNTLVAACMLFLATVALTLVGVATMLLPLYVAPLGDKVWFLVAAPALPLIGALACAGWLWQRSREPAFSALREQLTRDGQWFEDPEASALADSPANDKELADA